MTVAELIKVLEQLDKPNLPVIMYDDNEGEWFDKLDIEVSPGEQFIWVDITN